MNQHNDTGVDLDDLEAKARAATPGPWVATHWTCHATTTVKTADDAMAIAETTGFGRHSHECAIDAAFIAAANPDVVLKLISLVRRDGSWTPAGQPPDADTTVMLALSDGEVWQGYWNSEDYIEVSGLVVTSRVKYWQHTPKHPEDKS